MKSKEFAERVGLNKNQVNHWVDEGLITPKQEHKGAVKEYTKENVEQAIKIKNERYNINNG